LRTVALQLSSSLHLETKSTSLKHFLIKIGWHYGIGLLISLLCLMCQLLKIQIKGHTFHVFFILFFISRISIDILANTLLAALFIVINAW